MKRSIPKLLLVSLILWSPALFSEEGEVQPQDVEIQKPSVQEFYGYMQDALNDKDWWAAIDFGGIVLYHFPESPFAQEASFYIGKAYYELNQYELANVTLNEYLKQSAGLNHFEEALQVKFSIAEFFREGGKKRLFGSHKMPAIVPAQEDALTIYDEIIAALPHDELGVRSLLGKAEIQTGMEDYSEAIETLQLLIRRFPKHDLAAEAYLRINRVYLEQSQREHLDVSLLDLAEVNIQKFQEAFPREPRIADATAALHEMREIKARDLWEMGQFFVRRGKKEASRMYFSHIVQHFSDTKVADDARDRLALFSSQ